ncbi:MAG: hypothetical protein EXS13_07740 [Planctomycetes bacterium]|nr:hypothetical protein [Planctomycetota bacterium]
MHHGLLDDRTGLQKTLEALESTLDRAMTEFAACETLVIDVRLNGGGSDVLGVAIASRLTDRDYVAFVKRARNDPAHVDALTAPQETRVRPSARPRFAGRVFLLTGPDSVSAAETFTMALLGRQLPNGWRFGLPNEVFLTAAGEHFEARGVPPDHAVPVFAPEDVAAGRDACLDKVFKLIDDG